MLFNSVHAPIGAHASFTLGCPGRQGGFELEMACPPREDVYIGVEDRKGGTFHALPFFEGANDAAARYHDSKKSGKKAAPAFAAFSTQEITRDFTLGCDSWKAGDMTFNIYSPIMGIPDPAKSPAAAVKNAICPAVLAELTVDNRASRAPRRAFFGWRPEHNEDAVLRINCGKGTAGIRSGQKTAIFTDAPGAIAATGFTPEGVLTEKAAFNYDFGLGEFAMLLLNAPGGKITTFRFAVCFYRGGIVTTGLPMRYLYTRYFADIAAVGRYTLRNFTARRKEILEGAKKFKTDKLNSDQYFQFCQAAHTYFDSTELLEYQGKPVWLVNEGEYRMLNTFDLMIDQSFWEMRLNPWTLRNELDMFADRYSYTDKLHFPGGKNIYAGGIAFNHDMGQRNHFSAPGRSAYELAEKTDCFSHMSHEQVVNWVLTASMYALHDSAWRKKRLPVFRKCLQSLLHRDNPVAAKRNGIMALDSSRTGSGAEITTYDSLDTSLGQARNNLYLAVKTWAAYRTMALVFDAAGSAAREKATALKQARRAADTIVAAADPQTGMIPAVIGENCNARIIPAIEGLVFPYVLGDKDAFKPDGECAPLIAALKRHFLAILKKGICLYPDNGWKISSSADNSWPSKIYLCQFVARQIFKVDSPAISEKADKAHAG